MIEYDLACRVLFVRSDLVTDDSPTLVIAFIPLFDFSSKGTTFAIIAFVISSVYSYQQQARERIPANKVLLEKHNYSKFVNLWLAFHIPLDMLMIPSGLPHWIIES